MRLTSLRWDDDNVEHIARHGVDPDEVEEVCFARPLILRGRKRGGVPTYYALGQTAAGRYLFVVFCPLGGGEADVVTARDMSDAERKRYRGMRP